MSVSFALYNSANASTFCRATTTGNPPSRTPTPPTSSTLSASRNSFSERPGPIQCSRTLLIVARRKRLGHASRALPVTETQEPGKMLVIDCGRAEGYIEQKLANLSDLVNEGVEIGATYVGWG